MRYHTNYVLDSFKSGSRSLRSFTQISRGCYIGSVTDLEKPKGKQIASCLCEGLYSHLRMSGQPNTPGVDISTCVEDEKQRIRVAEGNIVRRCHIDIRRLKIAASSTSERAYVCRATEPCIHALLVHFFFYFWNNYYHTYELYEYFQGLS